MRSFTLTLCLALACLASACFSETELGEPGHLVDVPDDAAGGDADTAADTDDDTIEDVADDAPDAPDGDARDAADVDPDSPADADAPDVVDADVDVDAELDAPDADTSDADAADADADSTDTCVEAPEICNGADDDCDGDVDEDARTLTDPNNCGSCGTSCNLPNTSPACAGGVCVVGTCAEGWVDCDGEPANGCETSTAGSDSCTACSAAGAEIGEPCGTCDTGRWRCTDGTSITCEGDLGAAARNTCGGCGVLDDTEGEPCGTCDSGVWTCTDAGDLACDGDAGEDALDACGECATELSCEPAEQEEVGACGACGISVRTCSGECRYDDPECIEMPICEPGSTDVETRPCGPCDGGTQTRSRICASNGCSYSDWSTWSACADAPCSPGDTRPSDCGPCREQTCSSSCEWSVCRLGAGNQCVTGEDRCCNATSQQSCNASCQWSSCSFVVACF